MKKLFLIIVLFPGICFSQGLIKGANQNTIYVSTGIVMQNWKIDGVPDRIAEATFPFTINIPFSRNGNLQISHSPAISRYADIELSGFSDTWIRGNYLLFANKLLVSAGVGVPTGRTELTREESVLSGFLSQNVFRFRLPVFGQGLTLSSGVVYAIPVNKKIVMGIGWNYVYRGVYKFVKDMETSFDPGDQVGGNLGYSHDISKYLRLNVDFLYTYYFRDQINDKQIYGSGQKFGSTISLLYHGFKRMFWVEGRFRKSGRNETWDGIALITEEKNSNITQMEMDAVYRIHLSELFSVDVLFEGRSYIENEYLIGQADIVGGGLGNTVRFNSNLHLYMSFKMLYGDAYYHHDVPIYKGNEFIIRTTYQF
ncbi:hypothetical protein JXB12_07095 [candidate division KSB1 bacterium]|nr:hypothetical protein [candidate division KSB1 bacterium]